jgi:hypothetical protein
VHRRRSVRLRAVVTHPSAGWQRDAQVLNLGLGGACLALQEIVVPGERVHVSFVAPTLWDPLALPARVAWTLPPTQHESMRVGVSFEPPDAAAVYALFELMSTLAF